MFNSKILDACYPFKIRQEYPLFLISLPFAVIYDLYICITSSRPIVSLRKKYINFHGAYQSFVFVLFYLRNYLQDYTCSQKPNSVSGHAFFQVYFFINRLIDFLTTNRKKSLFHTLFFIFNEAMNLVNLSLTYLGGFHTPKQMIYGAIFGIIVICIYRFSTNNIHPRTMTKFYFVHMLFWMYLTMNFTSPKPSNQVLFPAFLWSIQVFVFFILESIEIKRLY